MGHFRLDAIPTCQLGGHSGRQCQTAAQTKLTWQRTEKVVQGALDTPLPEFDDDADRGWTRLS